MTDIETCFGGSIRIEKQLGRDMPYIVIYDRTDDSLSRACFRTEEDVEALITAIRETMQKKADERQSYPCPECDGDIMKIDGEWCCNKCDAKLGGGI